jgi:hypothetical protein
MSSLKQLTNSLAMLPACADHGRSETFSNEGIICHDFATTRLALIRFIQRIRDFSSREICFYAVKADYALYAALGPRLDTVGVWGSNPHAPTNLFPGVSITYLALST